MDLPLASSARCELRSVIRFLSAKNIAPVEIHTQLCEIYEDKCMSVQHMRKWCREFKNGRTDVNDEERSGRPSISDETVAKVEEVMLSDRRMTVRELSEMIPDVSKTSI
ncbi:protein GVQW3-like [Belonocnema kinseyi]|uniref:protein GVQW3-like n=1 Tax=Belonocnema kinseyi TaxID=2817044 RepID=UPI00143D0692|nr:protein GVQW3-like [Belonocnema kinseyi]